MSYVYDTEPVAPPPPALVAGPPARPPAAEPAAVGGRRERVSVPPMRRRWRRSLWGELWRWFVTVVLFAVAAGTVAALALVAAIYWQARTDQTRPVDAIVVLGTAQYNGRPGPVLRARLDHALAIYEAGQAPLLVVTGGRAPGDQFTEAEAARDYLLEAGVPAAAIVLENAGRDSWASMQGVAALLDGPRVLLVSDGFHLLRVKLMARDLGLTAFASPVPDSPIRPGGGAEFSYVLREAAGIAAHLTRTR